MQSEAAGFESLVVGVHRAGDSGITNCRSCLLDGGRLQGRPSLFRNRHDMVSAPYERYRGRLRVDFPSPKPPGRLNSGTVS